MAYYERFWHLFLKQSDQLTTEFEYLTLKREVGFIIFFFGLARPYDRCHSSQPREFAQSSAVKKWLKLLSQLSCLTVWCGGGDF